MVVNASKYIKRGIKKYEDGIITKTRHRSSPDEWIYVEGKHEPIISEDIFFASQEYIGKRNKVSPKKQLHNAFSGILRCSCGFAMKYIKEFKGLDRLTCPNMKHCNNRSARYSEVVDEIIKALRTYAEDVHELIDAPQKNTEIQKTVTASLVKELNALETQQERLYEFLEKGIYTSEVFVKRDTALAKRRSELSEAIAEAQKHEIKDIYGDHNGRRHSSHRSECWIPAGGLTGKAEPWRNLGLYSLYFLKL